MNVRTQMLTEPTYAPDEPWGDTFPGIVSAIALASLLAGFAWALVI